MKLKQPLKQPTRKHLILNSTDLIKSKKKNIFIKLLLSMAVLFSLQNMSAQEKDTNSNYKAFSAGAHLKNMHLWHGFVVTPGPMIATNLEYNSRNSKFTLGVWGGTSFGASTDIVNKNTGVQTAAHYQEFSLYTKYRFSDSFFIEAVSHNNYTGVEERGDVLNYWSYDKTQGYNFVDINFGYLINPNTLLYFATIINGGSGDYEVQTNGSLKNSWTHYLEVSSKVWEKDDASLTLFTGGAWSFATDKTFYTESAGNIINVGATFNKNIQLGSYNLPVGVTAMWNPEKEKTVLQVDFTIF